MHASPKNSCCNVCEIKFPPFLLLFQELYDQGARNYWIHNTGPLGCLPQVIATFGTDPSKLDELGCVSSHKRAAQLFNLQLHALCRKFQGEFEDANVTHVDVFTIKLILISNFSQYGKSMTAKCTGVYHEDPCSKFPGIKYKGNLFFLSETEVIVLS